MATIRQSESLKRNIDVKLRSDGQIELFAAGRFRSLLAFRSTLYSHIFAHHLCRASDIRYQSVGTREKRFKLQTLLVLLLLNGTAKTRSTVLNLNFNHLHYSVFLT